MEGFSPELAVVTIAGGKELEEPYVIRPTSETHRRPLLRQMDPELSRPAGARQPVGQRGPLGAAHAHVPAHDRVPLAGGPHGALNSHEEALEEVLRILDLYAEVAENGHGHAGHQGRQDKRAEKFAGALRSYSIEAMMQNGLALQAGTSHDLGQNFGKRLRRAVPVQRGQAGLRLADQLGRQHAPDRRPDHDAQLTTRAWCCRPRWRRARPSLCPSTARTKSARKVLEVATRLGAELGAHVDVREGQSPGAKFFHWERLGVPVVFELGPRDIASGNIVIKRRDTGVKAVIPQSEAAAQAGRACSTASRRTSTTKRQGSPEGQHRAGQLHRGSRGHPERRHGRKGRRQVRHGAP